MSTSDYFRDQGHRLVAHMAEETQHLHDQWATWDQQGVADTLKEFSCIAANLGSALHKLAGDALEMAERLDPTPVGFTAEDIARARLRLVKDEEHAAEVAAGEHEEAS